MKRDAKKIKPPKKEFKLLSKEPNSHKRHGRIIASERELVCGCGSRLVHQPWMASLDWQRAAKNFYAEHKA